MKLELTWDQCASLPVKSWVTSIAVCDGSVYIATGVGRFYEYNLSNNEWSQLSSPPYKGFSLAAVPTKKHLLAIGGLVNNNNTSNEVFLWDKTNKKWIIRYPSMPTSRWCCSSISHGSTVIVTGGKRSGHSLALTTAVEILHINDTNPYWSVAERLPVATYSAFPLIIDERMYISGGHGEDMYSTCNIVTTFLPHLMQSNNSSASSGQVWSKLPDMPCSSTSICCYQGRLITFGGDHLVEQTDKEKPVWELVPQIHLYNPDTKSWDCVGEVPVPYDYILGLSVQLSDNKILFIGGLSGTHHTSHEDDLVTTCLILTITPKHRSIIPY